MKSVLKFIVGIAVVSIAISIGAFVLWATATAFVVVYIFKAKDKYKNINYFFKEKKNVGAVIAAIFLLIVVPINFVKASKEYDKRLAEQKKQEGILAEQNIKEEEERSAEEEKASALNAKSKFYYDRQDGKDIESSGILTSDEIEKYNISEDEINKYNSDREDAIELEEKRKFENLARKYVKEYITSTPKKFLGEKSSYNEDKTKITVKGRYTGKNQYGASIRGGYEVEYDLSTEEVTDISIEKEKVE